MRANTNPHVQRSGRQVNWDLWGWSMVCFLSVGRFSTDLISVTVLSLTINQVFLYLLMAFVSLLALLKGYERFAVRGATLWIFLLSIWGAASFIWSSIPVPSFIKGVTFILLTLSACYFGNRLTPKLLVRGICYGVLAGVIVSAFLAIALPGVAGTTMYHDGAWRGLYGQKNVLGRAAMLAVIFLLVWHRIETGRRIRRRILLAAAFATFVLAMSQSATALVGVVVFLIAFPIARAVMLRGPRVRFVAFFLAPIVLVVAGLLISDVLDTALLALGRDADLTGRVPLWQYVWQRAQERLIVGFGVDVFFDPQYADFFYAALRWWPEHSHNGVLDLLLDVGLVGVFLFFMAFFYSVALVPGKNKDSYDLSVVSIATFLLIILQNVTESNLFRSSNLIWIVFVVISVQLSAFWARRKPRQRRPAYGHVRPTTDLAVASDQGAP